MFGTVKAYSSIYFKLSLPKRAVLFLDQLVRLFQIALRSKDFELRDWPKEVLEVGKIASLIARERRLRGEAERFEKRNVEK